MLWNSMKDIVKMNVIHNVGHFGRLIPAILIL